MHRTPAPVALAALLCAAQSLLAQVEPLDPERLAAVADSIAHHHLARDLAPGIAVAVAKDGRLVFESGYGAADVENRVATGPETVFRIGSITKQFTAAAVMRLVERGRIRLDAPITDYLPDYPTQGHRVSIHHLLNHTSGIRSYTGLGPAFWEEQSRLDLTDRELIDLFDELPFDFAPGEEYRYNNSAYYLLGVIIGTVTGTPYRTHLERDLLRPLGLEDTYYCDGTRVIPRRAEGYEYDETGLVNATFLSMNVPGAAGALCSTVRDLVRWTRLLHAGDVVSPSSLEAMTTPGRLASGDSTGYGYGLVLGELEGHRVVSHGGGINGFISHLAHYPDDGLTVAVLTNSGRGQPDRIAEALARTAFGLPLVTIADLALTDDELRRYTGTYRLGSGDRDLELRVFAEGGRLRAQATGQPVTRLRYQGDHTFVPDFDDAVRLVFEVEGGVARSLTLHQGGAAIPAERIR